MDDFYKWLLSYKLVLLGLNIESFADEYMIIEKVIQKFESFNKLTPEKTASITQELKKQIKFL
ncbi:MAG: hypothetical protein ACFFDH_00390 [Promethearchaeota archaeon]